MLVENKKADLTLLLKEQWVRFQGIAGRPRASGAAAYDSTPYFLNQAVILLHASSAASLR
jgi:hypothetical protein